MANWRPKEIIVHEKIRDDPVTEYILRKCKGVPVRHVNSGVATAIVRASKVLRGAQTMLDKILAGKKLLYIGPAGNDVVDLFTMPDERMMCPHFDRLKLASNGCFYQCDWCYLKLTYRAAHFLLSRSGRNTTRSSGGSARNCAVKQNPNHVQQWGTGGFPGTGTPDQGGKGIHSVVWQKEKWLFIYADKERQR